jgi:hypothetical protein
MGRLCGSAARARPCPAAEAALAGPAARFLCPFALPLPILRAHGGQAAAAAPGLQLRLQLTAALPDAQPGGVFLTPWDVVALLWLCGAAGLALYAVGQAGRLRRSIALAWRTQDGAYTCAAVRVPFVFGLLHPRVYLPESLTGPERAAVLQHEQAHLRRADPLWRAAAYAAVCLHWWNPAAWFAFRQFVLEMEAACDESATRGVTTAERLRYCKILYRFALPCDTAAPGMLSFSGGNLKRRITRILCARSLSRRGTILCTAFICLAFALCLAQPVAADSASSANVTIFSKSAASQVVSAPAGISEAGSDAISPDTSGAASSQTSLISSDTAISAPAPSPQSHASSAATAEQAATEFRCPVRYRYISCRMQGAHKGIDLAAPTGTPVYAAAAGTVVTAEYTQGFGNYVVLAHGTDENGCTWQTIYAHLDTVSVQPGDSVTHETKLGTVGSTGNSTGPHLHLQLQRDGVCIDPALLIPLTQEDA